MRYQTIPNEVQAVIWNGNTLSEFTGWVMQAMQQPKGSPNSIYANGDNLEVTTAKGTRQTAYPGFSIILDEQGKLAVYSPDEFKNNFTAVGAAPAAQPGNFIQPPVHPQQVMAPVPQSAYAPGPQPGQPTMMADPNMPYQEFRLSGDESQVRWSIAPDQLKTFWRQVGLKYGFNPDTVRDIPDAPAHSVRFQACPSHYHAQYQQPVYTPPVNTAPPPPLPPLPAAAPEPPRSKAPALWVPENIKTEITDGLKADGGHSNSIHDRVWPKDNQTLPETPQVITGEGPMTFTPPATMAPGVQMYVKTAEGFVPVDQVPQASLTEKMPEPNGSAQPGKPKRVRPPRKRTTATGKRTATKKPE